MYFQRDIPKVLYMVANTVWKYLKYVEEWINSLTTMIKLTMRNFGDGLDLLKMRLCC